MQIAGMIKDSLVDGPGLRTVIFFSGCCHECDGCHAQELWNPKFGKSITTKELLNLIEDNELCDGITLSGGDPVLQYKKIITFLKQYKCITNKSVMLYTGFEFKEIPIELLKHIDYVIDGKYDKTKPTTKKWRGSDNQIMYIKKDSLWVKEDE